MEEEMKKIVSIVLVFVLYFGSIITIAVVEEHKIADLKDNFKQTDNQLKADQYYLLSTLGELKQCQQANEYLKAIIQNNTNKTG